MKSSKNRICILFAAFACLVTGLVVAGYSEQGGVASHIKEAMAPSDVDANRIGALAPTGSFVQTHVKKDGQPFWTETRKDKISRYKCSQCHNGAVVTAQDAKAVAHDDILLDHGGAERPLSCFTCHKEDDRNFLETEEGVVVDMDHVYELCGQCHFRQKADWIGGAHGKRVDNWAGRRQVANCTSCHDPHSPKFKKRWPATYSLPLE